jgi:ABC-type proline/glycine betaine transport system ATPase subunit
LSDSATIDSGATQDAGRSGGARILLDGVTKRYDAKSAAAVDNVTLEIPAGEIVMLVGPSGCGKTTTMKMINRLIEPTSGRIFIGDDDVTQRDPDELRRHIGYVIQGAGLFPHLTVGDKIAILDQGSKIVQYDTPEEILGNPANDFVRGFVGHGAALKQLTLTRVRDVELHEAAVAHVGGDPTEAIRAAEAINRQHVIVLDEQDRPQRWLSLDELAAPNALADVSRDEGLEVVSLASTLNDALDLMLTSSHGVVVVTGRRNVYQGAIRVETIMDAMADLRGAPAREGS